ncbi:hypothetical protein OSTOST_19195 [Ostertagia ostertagi]
MASSMSLPSLRQQVPPQLPHVPSLPNTGTTLPARPVPRKPSVPAVAVTTAVSATSPTTSTRLNGSQFAVPHDPVVRKVHFPQWPEIGRSLIVAGNTGQSDMAYVSTTPPKRGEMGNFCALLGLQQFAVRAHLLKRRNQRFNRNHTQFEMGKLPTKNYVPSHFMKGTMIQMASGKLKKVDLLKVEDMSSDDFLLSAPLSKEFNVDASVVLEISRATTLARVKFAVGQKQRV